MLPVVSSIVVEVYTVSVRISSDSPPPQEDKKIHAGRWFMWCELTLVQNRVWVACVPARPYIVSVLPQPDTPEKH